MWRMSHTAWVCAPSAPSCALASGGGGRLIALACVDATGTALMPCGRCRQLLLEHGGPELLIDHGDGARRLDELLPEAFGPADLDRVRREKP